MVFHLLVDIKFAKICKLLKKPVKIQFAQAAARWAPKISLHVVSHKQINQKWVLSSKWSLLIMIENRLKWSVWMIRLCDQEQTVNSAVRPESTSNSGGLALVYVIFESIRYSIRYSFG